MNAALLADRIDRVKVRNSAARAKEKRNWKRESEVGRYLSR